jgi:hypothetical protein
MIGALNIIIEPDKLLILGIIQTTQGANIGYSKYMIPKRDQTKGPWRAEFYEFNIPASDSNVTHQGQGIGRRFNQKFLALLNYLGLEGLDLEAVEIGRDAWPRMGFDFAYDRRRELMLIGFAEYLREKNISLEPEDEQRLFSIQHAWELADFNVEGVPLGKEFLLDPDLSEQSYELRFDLSDDYPGWQQLLIPPHWEGLPASMVIEMTNYFCALGLFPQII